MPMLHGSASEQSPLKNRCRARMRKTWESGGLAIPTKRKVDTWRRGPSRENAGAGQAQPTCRAWFDVSPPKFCVERTIIIQTLRAYTLAQMRKGRFVLRAITFLTSETKIDNEHAARAARHVEAINPRHNDIGIWAPVRIWCAQSISIACASVDQKRRLSCRP